MGAYMLLHTTPSKGIPDVKWDKKDLGNLEELARRQVVVFSGRQSYANVSLLTGEDTFSRHETLLSHHPNRFGVGISSV